MSDYKFPYIKEEGSLHLGLSNRSGKKFTTWTFKPVNAKSFEVEIDLLYPSGDLPLRFSATSCRLKEKIVHTDIEELRKAVDFALKEQCVLFNSIMWEEWYEVVVSGRDNRRRGNESEFKISYGKLKRGVHPQTGEILTIHNNMVVIPFPKAKARGEDDEGFGGRSIDYEYSYIPATAENTAALDLLVERLGMLRNDVSNLLSQKNIKNSLEKIDGKFLLER